MIRTRTLFSLFAVQLLALAAFAQTDAADFRASGGRIDAIAKGARQTSGSLSLTHSTGAFGGRTYEGTLGGELLGDRLWFFGSASVTPNMRSAPGLTAMDAKATAQPVDWTTVTGTFSHRAQPAFGTVPAAGSLPTSFLSLRSTSVLSNNMTLGISISRSGTE